jgi:hypothetical protein
MLLVGGLIYLSHTLPSIVYVISVVSQIMHFPCESHMEVSTRFFATKNPPLVMFVVFVT